MAIVDEQFRELQDEVVRTNMATGAHQTAISNGTVVIRIDGLKLPSGWNKTSTTVHFVLPVGYPVARPDTFWTDPDLRLANGGVPANTGTNQQEGVPADRLWFSWHPSAWNANRDTIRTYLEIVRKRFSEAR